MLWRLVEAVGKAKEMLGQLNFRLIGLGVIAAVLFGSGWAVNGWRLEKRIADIEKKAAEDIVKAEQNARKQESTLRTNADNIRKTYETQITDLNGRLDTVLVWLRDRPERPSNPAPSTPAGATTQACTGSQLFREDADFLIREATRADTIRKAYQRCIAEYESVKSTLGK